MMDLLRFRIPILDIFTVCVMCVQFTPLVLGAPVDSSEIDAMSYLQTYGYMDESDSNSASMISKDDVQAAIREFQRFSGLPETGTLDSKTVKLMKTPRCGVKDIAENIRSKRRKRYVHEGTTWPLTDLTYRISKYSGNFKDNQIVDRTIAKAFKLWSDVSKLNFIKTDEETAEIDFRFEKLIHGDRHGFDGPGKTLAHAFFPQYGGDVHFDDDEPWTVNEHKGIDLLQVATHELGHSLGLLHSEVRNSIMFPVYNDEMGLSVSLDRDDILAIQALYGPRTTTVATQPPTPKPKPTHDVCRDPSIDTATTTDDGRTYFFKDDYYWEVIGNKKTHIADGYPRKISDDWKGLPNNLDAALTWSKGKTFFFKENQYWRFKNKIMDLGFPKDISQGFKGIPNNIDAVFYWSKNNRTYFFKGSNYWRYQGSKDPPSKKTYPQPISKWKGFPDSIDGALDWANQKTYIFKGNSYYRLDSKQAAVNKANPAFPRPTAAWWFGCTADSGGSKYMVDDFSLKENDTHTVYFDDDRNITPVTPLVFENDYVASRNELDVNLHQKRNDDLLIPSPHIAGEDANWALCSRASLLLILLLVTVLHSHKC